PPSVSLTNPPNGASFLAPANITLSATASDIDGSVTNVAFYASGTKLGDDASDPYTLTWSNVSAGNYFLTAVATDNSGLARTSSPVNVSVVSTLSQNIFGFTQIWKY